MKTIITDEDYVRRDEIYKKFYRCPNCKTSKLMYEYNYCPNCGIEVEFKLKEEVGL